MDILARNNVKVLGSGTQPMLFAHGFGCDSNMWRYGLNRPGIVGGSNASHIGAMSKSKTYSPEVRERAVRMVFEHAPEYPSQGAAIESITEKIGCSGETLRN